MTIREKLRYALAYVGVGFVMVAVTGVVLSGIAPTIAVSGWIVGLVMMFVSIFL